jgi:hypothetical protein
MKLRPSFPRLRSIASWALLFRSFNLRVQINIDCARRHFELAGLEEPKPLSIQIEGASHDPIDGGKQDYSLASFTSIQ